jgi:probable HAF family extracellular repeat protein
MEPNGTQVRHAFLWTKQDGMKDLEDLDTFGSGHCSYATDINEAGQVIGFSYNVYDNTPVYTHIFFWSRESRMQEIGPMGGNTSQPYSWGHAINSLGQVTGFTFLDYNSFPSQPWWWSVKDGLNLLSTEGGYYNYAVAINDKGQIVGTINNNAYLWTTEGGIKNLGSLPGFYGVSDARAINNLGQVIGHKQNLEGQVVGFFWTESGGVKELTVPGPWIPGSATDPRAINDKGQVIGSYALPIPGSGTHGYSWTESGGMRDLGTLGGNDAGPEAINNVGQVVGSSSIAPNGSYHPFVWTEQEGMQDLNNLVINLGDLVLDRADAINDHGWILCQSHNTKENSGVAVAVVLIPITSPTLAPVADKPVLWPPNNKMVDVNIRANVSDDNDLPVSLKAVVSCNESPNGEVYWTEPVIDQAKGIISLQLLASRFGYGSGRQYTITITATDSLGNSNSADVQVLVPRGHGEP